MAQQPSPKEQKISDLITAVGCGRLDKICELARDGLSMDAMDFAGTTPLVCAAYSRQDGALRLLLELGAGINVTDRHGVHCMVAAIEMSNDEPVFETILDAGADLSYRDCQGLGFLHHAAINNKMTAITALLRHGAPLEARDEHERTPLYYAARLGSALSCKTLCMAGADVEAVDDIGNRPLHKAAERGNESNVYVLRAMGTSPEGVRTLNQSINRSLQYSIVENAVLTRDVDFMGYVLQRHAGQIPADDVARAMKLAEMQQFPAGVQLLRSWQARDAADQALKALRQLAPRAQ